jgi:hypothetical protein
MKYVVQAIIMILWTTSASALTVDVVVQRASDLQGISNASVILNTPSGDRVSRTTDSIGSARFGDLPFGDYSIEVRSESGSHVGNFKLSDGYAVTEFTYNIKFESVSLADIPAERFDSIPVELLDALANEIFNAFLPALLSGGQNSSPPIAEPAPVQAPACKITQAVCPNSPTTVGTFEDDYGDANMGTLLSASNCMVRAEQYYYWCGGPTKMLGNTTTASYYSGSTVVQQTTFGNSCKITQAICPNAPSWVGTFEDAYVADNFYSLSGASACMERASAFYNWCGGEALMGGYKTTATFYSGSTPIQSTTAGGAPQPTPPPPPPPANLTTTLYQGYACYGGQLIYGGVARESAQACAETCDYFQGSCCQWAGSSGGGDTGECYVYSGGYMYGEPGWWAGVPQ